MLEKTQETQEASRIDLLKLLTFSLKRWWVVALCVALAAGVSLFHAYHFVTPMYRANAQVYVNNIRSDQDIQYLSGGNISASQQLVGTYIQLISSATVLSRVVEEKELDCTVEQLQRMLSASQVGETELFRIYITHPDAEQAAKIANAVADVAPSEIEKIVLGSSTRVIDYAKVPTTAYMPNYRDSAFEGIAVGLMLSAVLLLTLYFLDVRVKNEDDLSSLSALPVLGRIPDFTEVSRWNRSKYEISSGASPAKKVKKKKPLFLRRNREQKSLEARKKQIQEERKYLLKPDSNFFIREAYKTLRTNVLFSMDDEKPCKVIAVTSSMQSEGKSITAANLALSFAQTDKRVLLVDCDLRRPKVSRLLDLRSKNGLTNVLMEPELLPSAILTYPGNEHLKVMLSGNIPPNPSELQGSPRMERLLETLRASFDYIILDTPPANMVTDAVVLSAYVDGVLFVVRADHTERGAVAHALEQLEYSKAKVLGFILNGTGQSESGYGYGRKYGYRRYGYRRYGTYGYRSSYMTYGHLDYGDEGDQQPNGGESKSDG